MRLVIVLAPLVALGVYVLWRAIRGRPLSRFALNVVVALFLLVYLFVTAALGVFWVARMDLPAFDWHYLFGYSVVLLATLHVAFQLRLLAAFFRRASPRALLSRDGSAFRPAVRVGLGVVGAVALLGPLAWLAMAALDSPEPARVATAAKGWGALPRETTAATAPGAALARDIWIEREGGRISAFDYLHEQSSYSRGGLFRKVGVAPERPPDVKSYPAVAPFAFPAAAREAGVTLAGAFGARRVEGHRVVTGGGARPPTLAEFSDLAHYTSGVTSASAESGGISLRAAASSGALYPVDLYLVSGNDAGVAPGVYYYEPKQHAALKLAVALETLATALPEPRRLHEAAFAFVTAVTFDRTVSKYDVRSYRYVALDTGHVVANLLLAAAARGFDCRPHALFDDDLASSALGLDASAEAVSLVVTCRRGSPPPVTQVASGVERALSLPPLPERADEWELTRLSQRLTSVRLGEPGAAPPATVARTRSTAPGVALPVATSLARDLFKTIANRRSFREFSQSPLELAQLAAVLDAASRRPVLRAVPLVELHLLVRNVSGLEPGVYRYDEQRRVLEPRARGDRSQAIASAGLSQALLGRAAAVLVWTLAPAAGSVDGTRDYRTAHLEAGIGGENVYLAASALAIGACGVGAFYDDEVGALLADGASRPRALYLQALGAR
jgi:SagB-type dehydrogenase family enzyme